jgi:nucleotide-binding universal stress UspA family protein
MRTTFRSLLCPTDFSAVGNAAVAVARGLAARGGVLHLAHVREPAYVLSPMDASPAFVLPAGSPKEELAAEERALARLRRLVGPGERPRVRFHVLPGPGAGPAILRLARIQKVDAIVLGTHGRSGLGRLLLGSVASTVARKSPVTVILVHPGGRARRRR